MKRKLKLTFVALTIIYRTTLLANYRDWLYPKKRFWVRGFYWYFEYFLYSSQQRKSCVPCCFHYNIVSVG